MTCPGHTHLSYRWSHSGDSKHRQPNASSSVLHTVCPDGGAFVDLARPQAFQAQGCCRCSPFQGACPVSSPGSRSVLGWEEQDASRIARLGLWPGERTQTLQVKLFSTAPGHTVAPMTICRMFWSEVPLSLRVRREGPLSLIRAITEGFP